MAEYNGMRYTEAQRPGLFDEPQAIWPINGFLWHELRWRANGHKDLNWGDTVPFFPVSDSSSGTSQWQGKPYFIYNEAFRVENSLHVIKKATFVYSMRSTPAQTVPLTTAIQEILDRGDDAAQDINDFNNGWLLQDGNEWNRDRFHCPNIYFHSIEVYQNEQGKPRDGSSSPYVITNIMVVVKYHKYLPADLTVDENDQTRNRSGGDLSWYQKFSPRAN